MDEEVVDKNPVVFKDPTNGRWTLGYTNKAKERMYLLLEADNVDDAVSEAAKLLDVDYKVIKE